MPRAFNRLTLSRRTRTCSGSLSAESASASRSGGGGISARTSAAYDSVPVSSAVFASWRRSSDDRLGRLRKPSALPAAVPTRGRSEAYSKQMKRGCQVGRYLALDR